MLSNLMSDESRVIGGQIITLFKANRPAVALPTETTRETALAV